MRRLQYTMEPKEIKEDFAPETETLNESTFKEAAFKAGKALLVSQKLAKFLSKKLGIKIGVSPVPEKVVTSYGKFDGYFSFMSNGRSLRFNFLAGKSDLLHSIDSFLSAGDLTPEVTIDLKGFNIVQVANIVVDVINGEWHRYTEAVTLEGDKLQEARRTIMDMVGDWINNTDDIAIAIERGTIKYEQETDNFIAYIRDTFGSSKTSITPGSLQWNCRTAIENGLTNINMGSAKKIPTVDVKKGGTFKQLIKDPELQALYDEIVDPARRVVNMQEDYEADIRLIASGSDALPGLFVHGKAGVGKTYTVEKIFNEEGIKPIMIDTPIGQYKNFYKIVWDNAEDEIIVIDDNDTVLANEKVVGLLKKLLESKPVRIIDFNPPMKVDGETLEGEIQCTSKFIFITNFGMDYVNSSPHLKAIKSRLKAGWHTIDYSSEEMMTLIKDKLFFLGKDIPGVTDPIREEVFEFVNSISPVINVDEFDFRTFQGALGYRVGLGEAGGGREWKRRTMTMLGVMV
jgi:hypothetical protein